MVSVANKEYTSSRVAESGTGFKDMDTTPISSCPARYEEKKGKTGEHDPFYRLTLVYACIFFGALPLATALVFLKRARSTYHTKVCCFVVSPF